MKNFNIYLKERLNEYDILIKERLNEYDILIKERLNECDVIVGSLAYYDYLGAEECLLLTQCIERYQIFALTSVASDIEVQTHIEEMKKRCFIMLNAIGEIHQELRGVTERSFTEYVDAIEFGADEAALCAHIFTEVENPFVVGTDVLDFDAHTRFDGVEMRAELDEEFANDVRKYIRTENALALDGELHGSLQLYTEPEENELALSASIEGYAFVKLRFVSELDGNTLNEIDNMTLNELDYTKYESV